MSKEVLEGIATSDWHLDGLNKHFIDANDRILKEADKICQYAVKNGIKHVFIPGDISDTPDLGWDTYIKLFLFFKKYDGILNMYYIGGNHDFEDIENTSMNFLHTLVANGVFKTVHIFLKPKRIEIDGVPVNMLPFPCLETLSTKTGGLNFAHVEYTGAIGDNGRTLKTKHELKAHKYDFTISGHIHQYQYMKAKRAIYCGNPFQKNFGEELPKGFIHFKAYMDGKKVVVEHKRVENKPEFQLINLEINDLNDFKKLKKDDSIRYKLTIDAEIPIPPDLLVKYPNITGGIRTNTGALVNKADQSDKEIEKTDINLRTGLKQFLGSEGLNKKQIKAASLEAKKAINMLGLSQ